MIVAWVINFHYFRLLVVIEEESVKRNKNRTRSERPHPVVNLLRVHALVESVILRLDLLIEQRLAGRRTLVAQVALDTIDRIDSQAVAIRTIADCQLQRGINVALLPVTSDVHVLLTLASVCHTVNQPRV
jgi:ABC-type transporter Mla MlaB component